MIVPGTSLGVNHPFSWHVIVKERASGKKWIYWLNGSMRNRSEVAAHISTYYRNVDVIEIQDAGQKIPGLILTPIPPSHHDFGIIRGMLEAEAAKKRPQLVRRGVERRSIR